ncbi:glutathione S-transferase C-terminal-like protein [Dichomitus squalens]|uniref:Glutathione S-transferase C-terminal-like protein n=1 Tax=Dichomitus squalens TaxID=114155 RepID=A0A4Q9ND01_9APHY|nr:glutathione S-transferase C-terminal-like protein [Dichomitus squalens]TBU53464.1 glutathione S-transferase C-terminal-like protein [Dichomitus squalens]
MSHGKQFTPYTYTTGPMAGWKVVFVLEELGLTYESVYLVFDKLEHESPEYTKLNPNGRIPALVDHKNGDFVIWESDAILLYLVDKYDTEKRLTVTDEKERYSLIQWLFFQASGQGPYFGQAVPSAIERYRKEVLRVFSVLESVLSKQEWLVGGKPTIADFSFISWNHVAINFAVKDYADVQKDYPALFSWHQKLVSRDSVKRVFAIQESLNKH